MVGSSFVKIIIIIIIIIITNNKLVQVLRDLVLLNMWSNVRFLVAYEHGNPKKKINNNNNNNNNNVYILKFTIQNLSFGIWVFKSRLNFTF
jgi:hypothetical protein